MTQTVTEWLAYEPTMPAPVERSRARVISVFNQKGGVGKTTSCISIGAVLAEAGYRVLLVDFDPQGSLTVGLTGAHELPQTIYEALMGHLSARDVLLKTSISGMDLLPATIELSAAEMQLVNEVGRDQTLARLLEPLLGEYDVVLIDCLPSLGLLAVNALAASDSVLIPLQCEYYALRGMALLFATIQKVRERINARLQIEGIIPTMYDQRSTHHREVLSRVLEAFGDLTFHTAVPKTVKFPESTVAIEPITTYAASSTGASAYRRLAAELAERIQS
jgi:chromosome partitioning protein